MATLHPTEAQIQRALHDWLSTFKDGRQHAFHIPNEGKRSKIGGALLRRGGLKAGVADNFIPVAAGGWHGMFVELKAHGKVPSDEQAAFLLKMHQQGYFTLWTDSLDNAMRAIEAYVSGNAPRANWVHYSAPVKSA